MKRQIILFLIFCIGHEFNAQQNQTGFGNTGGNSANSGTFWARGGNTNSVNTNNIFGTVWNSPVFTMTNNANRMRLNGMVSYNVNSVAGVRDGFLLLGGNNNASFGTLYGAANGGAYSLLHLNGLNANNFAQESGFRSWMRFGITSTHNQDLMWMGQRSTNEPDITDAMINDFSYLV